MQKCIVYLLLFILLFSVASAATVDKGVEKELQKSDAVKVLIKLKSASIPKTFNSTQTKTFNITQKKAAIKQLRDLATQNEQSMSASLNESGFKIAHHFSVINGFSGKITAESLELLRNNPLVDSIQLDRQVEVSLDTSVPLIGGDKARALQVNGINITGAGETVCVVDTGINYQHPALGNCTITRLSLNGTIQNITVVESPHPYSDLTLYNYTINMPGFSNIAIHFRNLSVEPNFDQLKLYDSNWKELASYTGIHNNLWSVSVPGDTIHILWQTDQNTNDYGIYIDQAINGTTNLTYDWSTCSKVIGGWDFANSDADPMDDHSHGTHVAGIISSTDATYKGVAPGANLIAIKALDSGGGGTDSDVAAGIDWCINRSADYNISIISLSLGCVGSCTHWQSACDSDPEVSFTAGPINTANSLGISVFIASGNSGWTDGISSPACVSGAIPVGAVSDSDSIFYNRGNLLNLLAPGVGITSTGLGTSFVTKSGTSMATPHASGSAALLRQFVRLLNTSSIGPSGILSALNRTGKRIDDTANSGKIYSRIDVYSALLFLDRAPVITFVTPTPANNISSTNLSVIINVTVENTAGIDSCILEWNLSNTTMTKIGSGSSVVCTANKTLNSSGAYFFKVYANSTSGIFSNSSLRQINVNNPPVINLTYPSAQFSIAEPANQTFNITYFDLDNDSLSINWYLNSAAVSNSANYTFVGNYSTAGVYNVSVTVSDWVATTSYNWNMTINNTNRPPILLSASIIDSDLQNKTNGSLSVNYSYSDADNDNISQAEIRWYNNSAEVLRFANLSIIGPGNATRGQVWFISMRIFDGYNWSNFINSSSLTIQNSAPGINLVSAPGVNASQIMRITVSATDADNDLITYSINDSRFSLNGSQFYWQTNLSNYGNYQVRINVTDGLTSDSVLTSFTIANINSVICNISCISSSSPLKLRISGTENTSQIFVGSQSVNITDQSNLSLVFFNWNFTQSPLNVNWSINYSASNGTIVIRKMDLTSQGIRKTVYLNKSNSAFNYICIADDESTPVADIPSDCSGFTKVPCTGTLGQYSCTDAGDKFIISGLDHSALKEITVTTSISSGGGGGSSGGGATTAPAAKSSCTESWICTSWTDCLGGSQVRSCQDVNNCGTLRLRPIETQSCAIAPAPKEIPKTTKPVETAAAPVTLPTAIVENTSQKDGCAICNLEDYLVSKITMPVIIIFIVLLISAGIVWFESRLE